MYVVTIDQRDSRTSTDRVPDLLDELAAVPCVSAFDRTAGDEVQGLLDDPAAVRQALLIALRSGRWHCGVGVGEVDPASWESGTRAGRGPAYLAARDAVEAAKGMPGSVAIRVAAGDGYRGAAAGGYSGAAAGSGGRSGGEGADSGQADSASTWAADCEAVWSLVAALVLDRTDAQWRVVDAVDTADTQAAAADALDITPSSVTGALRLSRIREERAAYGTLDRLLAGAHAATGEEHSA